MKSAVKSLPLKVDEILVDIYYHFHNSVKSIVGLKEYAEFCDVEFKSILKHSETRWLSLTRSLKRTLEMWEPLLSYFTSHPDVEKTGKVRSIYGYLSDPSVKLWMLFLQNTLVIFDKFNESFQTSRAATIHRLHSEGERLLQKVLTFFVKPSIIRASSGDLTGFQYSNPSNQLANKDIFIGDETTAFYINLTENEGVTVNNFYVQVKSFYVSFLDKLRAKFDFGSGIFKALRLLCPTESQKIELDTFDFICDSIAIQFDKSEVKLEFREFAVDSIVSSSISSWNKGTVDFWLMVKALKTPMGETKYQHLSELVLQLLSIPTSNADCERVFSLVRRIKTDSRSSLLPETISSLIGIHFNSPFQCCEQTDYSASCLEQAKSCTREMNLAYSGCNKT